MEPIISIIAAIDERRGLGNNNRLLFHIPEDMKRFRKLTEDHVVIMGRKTYESIGHALPNRTNIVVTRDKEYSAPDCIVVHSLDEALNKAREMEKEEIFIIGGGELYRQAIDKADKLYLTLVAGVYEADTFFPDYSSFTPVSEEKREASNYRYSFLELIRTAETSKHTSY